MNSNQSIVPSFSPSAHRRERGQGMVELAGSMMFLLMLLVVTVDLGWAFYTLTTLRDSVQEASAYGAICPLEKDNVTPNTDLIKERFRLSAPEPIDMRTITDLTVTFTNATGATIPTPVMGGSVTIEATIEHEIVVPFLGAIIGRQSYPLTVSVTNTVMRSKWLDECDY